MCGIKKFVVPETTEGTLVAVGLEDPLPERTLMKPAAGYGGHVLPASLSRLARDPGTLLGQPHM